MYILRLLKDYNTQIFRSGNIKETVHVVPEGKLKQEDLYNTYVRIECQCIDSCKPQQPLPLELRSETFIPLEEAL